MGVKRFKSLFPVNAKDEEIDELYETVKAVKQVEGGVAEENNELLKGLFMEMVTETHQHKKQRKE